MRPPGFLLVLITSYYYCQLVVSNSEDVCPSTCGNLKKVMFPFGAAPSCGASPRFLLSNCSTMDEIHWYNFNETSLDGESSDPPVVKGIVNNEVNLTWSGLAYNNAGVCNPISVGNIGISFPSAINLTAFADSDFEFYPSQNIFLLFNCSANKTLLQSLDPAFDVKAKTSACKLFQSQCAGLEDTPCFQYEATKELMLKKVMDGLGCTSFKLLVTLSTSLNVSEWGPDMVQLSWNLSSSNVSACANCEKTNGSCGYGNDDNFMCLCPGNKHSNTDCDHIPCTGCLCSTAFKVTIGVAVSVVALAILVVLALFCRSRRRRTLFPATSSVHKGSSAASSVDKGPTFSSNQFWTQRALCLSSQFGPAPTNEFSYEELLEATESFADEKMIGDGGFGAVYVGFLRDGRKAAIKRLYHDNFRRMAQFYNEMKILSTLQHPNLVELYGFCCEDESDLLLVFEYASKGTVSDQLHDVTKPGMPWKVRLNIAWETAEALSYLHNSVSRPIFHRDVKTTNILLDENFHAKLADFGLSRLVPLEVTHISTVPYGTPGYLDPDYHQCYQLTEKSDVYSFGVVLMELVSAKLAVDMSRDRREINLSSLALIKIACGAWEELVDPRLEMGKNADVERMVKGVVELAFQCLHAEKDDRPNMSAVAETLANLRRESGYGYEEVMNAENLGETSQVISPKSAYNSPMSVYSSVWTSSNTSSRVSGPLA